MRRTRVRAEHAPVRDGDLVVVARTSGARGLRSRRTIASRLPHCNAAKVSDDAVIPPSPKDVVRRFFGALGTGDFAAIGEFFTDDSVWQVNDVARGLPAQRGRKGIIDDFLQPIREGLFEPGDPKVEIRRLIGEDDWVVAETTARGMLLNGNHYQNEYVFVIQVAGGTVRFLREYMDSDYAHSVSAGSGGAGGAAGHVSQALRRLGHD